MPQPEVSVVIPTRDRCENVVRVVRRVLEDPGEDLEVVVVDDGSTDGTSRALQEIAEHDRRLVPVRQEGSGKRVATRTGTEHARGRILVLLDDDVLPAPGTVRGHLEAHGDREDLLVVGYMPTVVPEPVTGASFATLMYAREYEGRCASYERDPSLILRHLWMGNVSIPRAAMLRLVRTAAPFGYRHEDRDFGIRAAAAGLTGVFDRRLRAEHQHARTVEQFARDCVQQGAGAAEIAGRYPGTEPEDQARGLPRPLAAVVHAARYEPVRRPLRQGLVGALTACTRLGDPRPAVAVAQLLRRIEKQHGAAEVAARAPRSATAAAAPPSER